jgi:hypothetical protein
VGRDISVGATVAGGGTGVSVDGIASGVGEEQEMRRRRQKEESSICFTACLYMGGF